MINPDSPTQAGAASTETAQPGTSSTETAQPLDNHVVATWKNLKTAYTKETVPSFTEGQLVSYFVCRTVADGLPAGDFKSINKSAKYLFDCGHVQDIHIGSSTTKTLIKASCLPEMKKDRVYKILMSLDTTTWDILNADCGCSAGLGPNASCKHVGALCYALVEFCKSGKLPDFLTCTQKLQEWNKPRPRKLDLIQVEELTSRRKELICAKDGHRYTPAHYDPRPMSLRSPDMLRLEELRRTLLHLNHPCVLTQLLRAPVKVALHDHNYAKESTDTCTNTSICTDNIKLPKKRMQLCAENRVEKYRLEQAKSSLNVTSRERMLIEKKTRSQALSFEWFDVRARRITGSKCGKIYAKKKGLWPC